MSDGFIKTAEKAAFARGVAAARKQMQETLTTDGNNLLVGMDAAFGQFAHGLLRLVATKLHSLPVPEDRR